VAVGRKRSLIKSSLYLSIATLILSAGVGGLSLALLFMNSPEENRSARFDCLTRATKSGIRDLDQLKKEGLCQFSFGNTLPYAIAAFMGVYIMIQFGELICPFIHKVGEAEIKIGMTLSIRMKLRRMEDEERNLEKLDPHKSFYG
jgi:hypothetical protein